MISNDDITRLAELSRLELKAGEAEEFKKDISEILSYVGEIGESDTAIEPSGENVNVMREDEITNEADAFTEALLDAAPAREGQFVKVHKILMHNE